MQEKNLETRMDKELVDLSSNLPDYTLEIAILDKLKKKGFPEYFGVDEIKEGDFLDLTLEQKTLMRDLFITARKKRKDYLGHEDVYTGYHASPVDLNIKDKIDVGEDGKAYYSDQYSLFSRWGFVNFIYFISADAKFRDEKEPHGCNGRFYSRSPLTILRKWAVKDFMNEHPGASFRRV